MIYLPSFTKVLKPGDRGPEVREVQKKLNALSYNAGLEDGVFGETTRSAVIAFQQNKGLTADGIVGRMTWQALFAGASKAGIVIDISDRKLSLYLDGQLNRTFPVAVGKKSTPTPAGNWTITKKGLWGRQFGGYFMQLSVPSGIYGIHGTNKPWSIGKAVSNGCIRMYSQDARYVYNLVSIGTVVKIKP